ncbi:MAG: hypothetical protein ACP5UI_04040, partial [Thermoprotei archaeon]
MRSPQFQKTMSKFMSDLRSVPGSKPLERFIDLGFLISVISMSTARGGGLLPLLVLLLVLIPSAALILPSTYPNLAVRVTDG